MAALSELLDLTHTLCQADLHSRKRVLQVTAELLADGGIEDEQLFDGLMARERLGSTSLGEGVAIPHCRVACEEMKVALITLDRPVDFEAPDQQPVDIVFVLVVPEHETRAHLDALAALATIFSDPGNRDLLRECQDAGSLEHTMQQLLGDYQAAQNLKHSKSA